MLWFHVIVCTGMVAFILRLKRLGRPFFFFGAVARVSLSTIPCFDCRALVDALDVFDDLPTGASGCSSHVPLLSGYDEPEKLYYQIPIFLDRYVLTSDIEESTPFRVIRAPS